jgi:hypothetical protein
MKKYLMTGIAAIAMCAAFTSCSKDPGFEQTTPEQIAQAQYDAAFIKAFGQPAANQDWGFGSRSITRAAGDPEVIKKDVWENFPDKLDGNAVPADVTEAEAAYVYAWFQKEENKGLTEEGKPWTNFFLQQVYGTMDKQKKGIWHRYDQNRVNNGYASNYYDEEFTDKGGMDYLTVGDGTTMTHVLDFNAEKGGPWNIVYMKNSSAMQFGYHGSWDSSDRQLFKLAQITVPGECFGEGEADRTAWYVGLSLLAEKDDNGKKVLGEQRKDWGDDWILKVVPGVSKPNYRVIAEDLNASEKSDFDFNDVVFDIIPNGTTSADIKAIAAGGIYKLTVNGVEVHEKFGESAKADGTYPMINTGDGPTHDPVVLCTIQGDFTGSDAPAKIKDIVIKVYKPGFEENGIELTATTGKPACKILVDDTFDVVTEREDISNEYKNFTKYVGGEFVNDFWWK